MSTRRIAERVNRIKPSPSSAAADRANELRQQGIDIINLVVGEPDFDTPAHIGLAAKAAIDQGKTRYTANAGTLELRNAIVDKLQRENDLTYEASQLLITSGAKAAIYTVFAATLEQGDEVIVPAPYWVTYPDAVLVNDGTPITVPCPEADGFKLTPEALRNALTSNTKWLVLNSPSNPTGACYSNEEYAALAKVLADYPDVLVMTDDIYEHIRFNKTANAHLLNAAPALKERTIIINGVSKSYAMTGWRIGFAAGPKDLINACAKLQSQSSGNACSVSQAAAVAAYQGDQHFVQASAAVYEQRCKATLDQINAIEGLRCLQPDGAFYLYINCSKLIGLTTPDGQVIEDDQQLVLYLLDVAHVAVVPGSAYGLSPYFRLSIATSQALLDEGCKRIENAIQRLK